MDSLPKLRVIDVLLYEDLNLLDVAGAVQAFDTAFYDGRRVYQPRYVSVDGRSVRASNGLVMGVQDRLRSDSPADDLLVPGGEGAGHMCQHPKVLDTLRDWVARPGDQRLISICSGALVLAAAGVLDGRRATTHWARAAQLAQWPKVQWDLDRICVDDGRVYTSAGVSTGIDLALSIIRADCGKAVALDVARELVVQLRRSGGQSQYAMHLAGQFTDDDLLTQLIEAIVADPRRRWDLPMLAQEAGVTARTLSRRFRQHMDVTPIQFVERVRVDHARSLLEARLPLKQVAHSSGFGDTQRLRRAFDRQLNTAAAEYAQIFGTVGE
ncbi:hypothetical protein BFP70_06310 [Thioclava sp. SK-1]|uniref:GlxA family transcriptional regulator n=1 Tax=Thioclava sp. SK-1 TaxID=1889770 RepID=UPI0008271D29|nr:DJ-1/PfpI family protein [Thioclava sp. SK-1]OCX65755.1 hypothetical protein BFP70_06310 [Thioclava sp. SK-1]